MVIHRTWLMGAMAVLGIASLATVAPAESNRANQTVVRKGPARPAGTLGDLRIQSSSDDRRIDVNNINMFVTNVGSFANDFQNRNNPGFFFPKGTNKTAVYESGIWIGGKITGAPTDSIRVAIAEYGQEFQPGVMTGPSSWADPTDPAFITYKVKRYSGSDADTAHVERDPALVAKDRTLDPLVHHSWSEYMRGAAPYGAPWKMYDLPDPQNPGSTVQVPGPDVKGDQMLWSVFNDANPAVHTNQLSLPLGVEIQNSTFAFDRQGALGNTIFLDYKVINKSVNSYDSCYVILWSDPDLGGAGDDLVGCDTSLSVGYVYNATNTDQLYADRPPSVGYDYFKGPQVGSSTLGMTSFIYYINGTDPSNAQETYNYMRGYKKDGSPIINPITNLQDPFMFSGDPVSKTGWLDSNASDRRFMCISGPFTMAAGDTQTIVGAVVVAQGGDRLSSITGMKFFDIKAQKAFDLDFQLPPPPPQPIVSYSTDHGSVNLSWDAGSKDNYIPDPGYAFEGYNIYQGASVSGPWKRLATYDAVNGIDVVRDSVFDISTGQVIRDSPVCFGGDNGVKFTFRATDDAIRGGSLLDGQTYFFAVTAYSVNENPAQGLDKVLETSYQPIAIVPQRPASGTDVASAYVNGSVVHRADTNIPPTTDHVVVDVVDPAAITGHTYAISFSGSGVPYNWSLVDRTTGQTLLANQTERSETPSYPPIDGMVVKLRGPQTSYGPLNDVFYTPFDNDMPFHGVGAGLGDAATGSELFDDSFGYGYDFFDGIDPSAEPNAFVNVELRFGSTQPAYVYYRDELADGGAPAVTGRGYSYGGLKQAPFQAWDVDNNIQLEVGYVERRVTDDNGVPAASGQPATYDGIWMPDGTSLGGREYLAISALPFTGAETPDLAQDEAILGPASGDPRWLYDAWLFRSGNVKAGDKFVIMVGDRPATPNDTLVFTTSKAVSGDPTLQRANLNRIRAVPNPYYAHSAYELSSLNRVMKFVNMPEQATVRIYNLAGELIRTLRKTDAASSILEWDLLTENRLPVASGVYVYHVDVKGAGQTFGKLVVFVEKERLSNF
jgi:hypothetical protein